MTSKPYLPPSTPQRLNAADEILGPPLAAGLSRMPALLHEGGQITFGELDRLANRYGNALRARGTQVGERLLFLLDDSPELVAAYLGALRIGAVPVALNIRLAPKDLLFCLADTEATVLFIHTDFLPVYREMEDELEAGLATPPQRVIVGSKPGERCGLEAFLAGQSDELVSRPMAPQDMAFWIYSSGTTGRPKAAVHAHRDVLIADAHLRANLGVAPGDRVFTTSKMFFAFALGHSLFGALRCGASVVVFQGWPDAASIGRVAERWQPTVLFSVPTMYRNLLRDGVAGQPAFRSVRHYVSAGEKLPEPLFQQWLETTHQPILEGIGTSETIFLAIANTPRSYRAGSCGRPLPWVELQLVDENGAAVTAPDTPGRIGIRMGSTFSGYWKQPELSARFLHGDWYFSGDMFSFDADGWWYHHGRADDMLKVSGQWVSPTEIEECALRVAELAEAAVIGITNADGLMRLALFAVPHAPVSDEAELSQRIIDTVRNALSVYKCPRTIRFVDALPRTATGKIQKFKLKQTFEAEAAA